MEQFVARVFQNGKVTVPKRLRELLEHTYPDKPKRRLIEEMFTLLHTVEGLKPCEDFMCGWDRRRKYPETTNYDE